MVPPNREIHAARWSVKATTEASASASEAERIHAVVILQVVRVIVIFERHPVLNHGTHVSKARACPQLDVVVEECLPEEDNNG